MARSCVESDLRTVTRFRRTDPGRRPPNGARINRPFHDGLAQTGRNRNPHSPTFVGWRQRLSPAVRSAGPSSPRPVRAGVFRAAYVLLGCPTGRSSVFAQSSAFRGTGIAAEPMKFSCGVTTCRNFRSSMRPDASKTTIGEAGRMTEGPASVARTACRRARIRASTTRPRAPERPPAASLSHKGCDVPGAGASAGQAQCADLRRLHDRLVLAVPDVRRMVDLDQARRVPVAAVGQAQPAAELAAASGHPPRRGGEFRTNFSA